jgi:hypothetical protein
MTTVYHRVSARKQHRARGRHLYHTQQRALKCARLNSAFYGNAAATRLPYPAITPIMHQQHQQDSSSVLIKTAGSDTATVGLAAARHSSVSPSDELQDFAEQLICHEKVDFFTDCIQWLVEPCILNLTDTLSQ